MRVQEETLTLLMGDLLLTKSVKTNNFHSCEEKGLDGEFKVEFLLKDMRVG